MNRGKADLLEQLDQQEPVRLVLELGRKNKSIDLIPVNGIKYAPVFRFIDRAFNCRRHQRYAYFLGHLLRRFTPSTFKIALGREINNTDQPGYSFRKYLKALTPDLNSGINADARDVAAWPRNVRYNSEPDWISGYGYNRNCVRECFETVGQGAPIDKIKSGFVSTTS